MRGEKSVDPLRSSTPTVEFAPRPEMMPSISGTPIPTGTCDGAEV